MAHALQLQEITQELLDQAISEWEQQLAEHDDVNPARSRGALARCKDILDGHHDLQYCYAYVGPTGSIDGLVLLSHACPNSAKPWLKVLELTLAPAFVDSDNPAPLDDLIQMAGTVVSEVFELSSDKHKSESVKIYGDSIMDVRIWKSVAQKLRRNSEVQMPFDATSHGRWLVLTRNGR